VGGVCFIFETSSICLLSVSFNGQQPSVYQHLRNRKNNPWYYPGNRVIKATWPRIKLNICFRRSF